MRKITKEEINTVLESHALWLNSNKLAGKRADFTGADLTDFNLSYAMLRAVDLTYADFTGVIHDEVGK